jgi:hypothetical protein
MPVSQERRRAARIDKVFRVLLSHDEAGDQWVVGRNISSSGMFVEMADPVPLNTKVIIRFQMPGDDATICAIARVKNHYYLQYSDAEGLRGLCGIGLRFLRFVAEAGPRPAAHRLH